MNKSLMLVALIALLSLVGCGQKGPLVLPQPEQPQTQFSTR